MTFVDLLLDIKIITHTINRGCKCFGIFIPSADTHPRTMAERQKQIRMELRPVSVVDPPFGSVVVGIRKHVWVSEVDQRVQIDVGALRK